MRHLTIPALAMSLLCACVLAGQTGGQPQQTDCERAIQVIQGGGAGADRDWALGMIRARCGAPGAAALATAFSGLRASSDSAQLNSLTAVARGLHDGNVFATSYAIARDRSASTFARVFAIRSLIFQLRPGGGISYQDLAGTVAHRSCYGRGGSRHTRVQAGSALPGDYVSRVNALGSEIANDGTQPQAVRTAAYCLVGLDADPNLPTYMADAPSVY